MRRATATEHVRKRFAAAKAFALNGADVNYQDAKGRTALHHGIEKEFDPSLLTWLVNHGASPDVPDRQGVTARVKYFNARRNTSVPLCLCVSLQLRGGKLHSCAMVDAK